MPLHDGSVLGSYEVVSALGVGGMGEVYRARDTKLGREVAIKVLPESVAADPDRLARFQREAQVLASLNHPNIAHVHGLEESGAVRALVMELVEGEDLAGRLSRGPIPLDEALPIARQIAEAVEAAHEVGIVHRDLKPANIKVRADGMVKVLDFGLAKALDPASAGRDVSSGDPASNSPTITTPAMTRAGVILGTAAYMSPEQARGKPVDKRADIWAFGAVLYEMLTGARLFSGDTVSDVLAAVLTREPDLTALPESTPAPVRRLLGRCLERDPRKRLRDIGDARYELGDGAQADVAVGPVASSARRTAALPWIVAAVALVLAAVGFLRGPASPAATTATASRFTLLPGPAGEIEGFPAISPDGQTIVFGLIPDDGVSHLWAFSFATGESRLLPDTDYGTEPFWSPDGRSVAYFSRGQLRRIEIATGLSRALAPASDNRGGTWTEGGEIIFTPNSATGLFRASAEGGEPAPLTTLDPSAEESHRYPTALPGGQAIIYSAVAADNSPQVGLFWRSLRDGTTRRLAPEVSRTAFDPRGFLLWLRQGGLVAQRFDPRAGALAGEPFPIAARVGTDLQRNGKGWFDAGAGIVATRATTSQLSQLRWYDRAGKRVADVTSPGRFYEPALSPDGKSVAVSVGGADAPRGDVWVFDTGGKDRARRLTFGGVDTPMWSSDGRWVMFGRRGKGGSAITRRLADGSGAEETIYVHPHNAFVNTVSPRDPLAAFESYGGDGNEDLWLLPLDGERKARPLLQTAAAEGHSAFSPDGRLLAYTSDESGLPQIYVREVDGAGNHWQLTTEGGDVATWGSRGREIFYVGLDRVLRALPITQMAPFQVGEPVKLFRLEIPSIAISGNRTFYIPSPDGQRFLVNAQVAPASEPGLRMVLNWRPPTGTP